MASNGGLKNLKSFIIESGQDNSLDNLLQCDWDGLQALTLGDFENLMSCELPGDLSNSIVHFDVYKLINSTCRWPSMA